MSIEMKQDARQKALKAIRIEIENGTYKIEVADLAEAILRTMQEPPAMKGDDKAA